MPKLYNRIFITVGTTRFDLLCEYMLSPAVIHALKEIGCKEVVIQIGNSDVDPGNFTKNEIKFTLYRFKDSILEDIKKADLVISHAGAGSCLEVLEEKKPLLVVVNEDLMDNHQLELAEQLQIDGHLYYCTCDTLVNTLNVVDFELLRPFPKANPILFVRYLDDIFRVYKNID
uniref:UDP-N-acetylglucosamine transferase subunit ALG13 n=1 Tax=Bombyx mori TaxID=7091 RepID=A0A8R2DLQ2_BOMMO|nr:UDP-N-acetylglucosamine transferase subunit ALG13 homolog [Bombyx mori]